MASQLASPFGRGHVYLRCLTKPTKVNLKPVHRPSTRVPPSCGQELATAAVTGLVGARGGRRSLAGEIITQT